MMRAESLQTVLGVLLLGGTLALFSRACANGFVNYDDTSYVTQNAHVQGGLSPHNVAWAFRSTDAANWHPLTWLSLQLDAALPGGLNAGGFHLTNVLLHALNTALLFLVLSRLTGAPWRSAMVAALFGLHPLHVESVTWVAERKRASFLFRYEIQREETGDGVATGTTRHACWHPETQRMIAIPEWLEPLLAPEGTGP